MFCYEIHHFFTHIMFLNNMGAQGIRHVINILGYVRDIPDRAYFTSCQLCTALDISTGPLARRTFQSAGPVRASAFHLSLARTGHLDICRASRFQIVLARTMTNHSMYFSRGSPPNISAVFAQSFCYSETPTWRESESGMSIKHTDVSV